MYHHHTPPGGDEPRHYTIIIARVANAERGNLHPQQPHEIASADFVILATTEGAVIASVANAELGNLDRRQSRLRPLIAGGYKTLPY